ncbi:hypothetical protein [Candidatus Tisiphia endosymbiont of Beris chalybata]|uniref:hypothetical protein n=1 Tax=Candidatus Tisiphia endosymbiont of Beris chalybata TaxID=3066262 RepID=UPI00312C7CB5
MRLDKLALKAINTTIDIMGAIGKTAENIGSKIYNDPYILVRPVSSAVKGMLQHPIKTLCCGLYFSSAVKTSGVEGRYINKADPLSKSLSAPPFDNTEQSNQLPTSWIPDLKMTEQQIDLQINDFLVSLNFPLSQPLPPEPFPRWYQALQASLDEKAAEDLPEGTTLFEEETASRTRVKKNIARVCCPSSPAIPQNLLIKIECRGTENCTIKASENSNPSSNLHTPVEIYQDNKLLEKLNCPKGEAWSDWLTGPFVSYSGSGYDKIIERLSPCDKTMTKNTVRLQSTSAEEPIITMTPVIPSDTTSSSTVIALSAISVGVVVGSIVVGVAVAVGACLYKHCGKSPPGQGIDPANAGGYHAPAGPPSREELENRHPHGGNMDDHQPLYVAPQTRHNAAPHNNFSNSTNCHVYEAKIKHIYHYHYVPAPRQAAEVDHPHLAPNAHPAREREGDGHHHDGWAENAQQRGEVDRAPLMHAPAPPRQYDLPPPPQEMELAGEGGEWSDDGGFD